MPPCIVVLLLHGAEIKFLLQRVLPGPDGMFLEAVLPAAADLDPGFLSCWERHVVVLGGFRVGVLGEKSLDCEVK